MDKKPSPYIPLESYKTQRVEVYINDLQTRLQQLQTKHDTIFVECCDILKKIQEVSHQTITKQQEIGRIIHEFEELGLKSNTKECCVLNKALIQKVGDVKRLREKFEKIFQDNLNELMVRSKCSVEDVNKIHPGLCSEHSMSTLNPSEKQRPTGEEERDSVYWSTIDSYCSLPTDAPESLCLEENEVQEAMD